MIKANYTPDQAAFLTGFPHSGTMLEDLAALKGVSPEKIEPLQKELGRQGMIYKSRRGNLKQTG
jgi:hypothetical protein